MSSDSLFHDPSSPTGWPREWTPDLVDDDPVHTFEPGQRVYHDVRRIWGTVMQCNLDIGQSLVAEENGSPLWLSNHHLWLTDGTEAEE
jgi:hypothetical protein